MTQAAARPSMPVCFAVPAEFHPIRPGCSNCACVDACGATITQLVAAIEAGSVPNSAFFKGKLGKYKSALTFWEPRSLFKAGSSKPAVLSQLALNAERHEQSLESPNPDGISTAPLDGAHTGSVSASDRAFGDAGRLSVARHRNKELSASTPTGTTSPHRYAFPMPETRAFEEYTNAELAKWLAKLLLVAFGPTDPKGYSAVRNELCAIHVEMNLRQLHAPAFRLLHALPYKATNIEEQDAARDRQVIDLHWRAHSSAKPHARIASFETVFETPFDVRTAEAFAERRWSNSAKAVHLHLTEEMQWEQAIIRADSIRKAWSVIQRGDVVGAKVKQQGAPQVEVALQNESRRRGRKLRDDDLRGMVEAWKAKRVAGRGAGAATVAHILAIMTGRPERDRSAVARTLKALDDYLGKS